MSWEDDRVDKKQCPCGKGTYSVISSSDDWNRFRVSWAMNCPDCKLNYRLFEFTYYQDGMTETGFRWVKTEIFDRARDMMARAERLKNSCVADAKAKYLETLVQLWANLSKKDICTKLQKGLSHFSSLGTFYKHTKGMDRRTYLADLFQENQLLDLLRLIGIKDSGLEASFREANRLKSDADKLLHGR